MPSQLSFLNDDALDGSEQDVSLGDYLYTQQINLLTKRFPFFFYLSSIIALIFTYSVWPENNILLIGWLSSLIGTILSQFFISMKFNHSQVQSIHSKTWEVFFITTNVIAGLLWGSSIYWLDAEPSGGTWALHLLILFAMTGAGVAIFSIRPVSYLVFLLGFILPYTIKLYRPDSDMATSISLILITYTIVMAYLSFHIHNNIRQGLALNYNNNQFMTALHSLSKHARATLVTHYANILEQTGKKPHNTNNEAITKITADAFGALSKELIKHHELEKELMENRLYLESILAAASDVIITTDERGIILSANPAVKRDLGYNAAELKGKSVNILLDEEIAKHHDKLMANYMTSSRPGMVNRLLEITCRKKNGSMVPIEIRVSEVNIGERIIFISILRDISDRKESEARFQETLQALEQAKQDLQQANANLVHSNKSLKEQSLHDALTGLYNRRYLEKALESEWLRHRRSQKEIAIILLDIDYFKLYNDHYGHIKGDECLVKLAHAIEDSLFRPGDFVARYGGEEFIVVLPTTDTDGAYKTATRIGNAVYDLNIEHVDSKIENRVTISSGIASTVPLQGKNYSELVEQADQALYLAKENGRNRVIRADSEN